MSNDIGTIITQIKPYEFRIGERIVTSRGNIGKIKQRFQNNAGFNCYFIKFSDGRLGHLFEDEIERPWNIS